MVQANVNGPADHEKHSSDDQECEQHSKDTSAQWYASGSFSHPLTLFPAILSSSLHPSVYSGLSFSQSSLQSSSIQVLQPNKTFFNGCTKAAMYFFVCRLFLLSHSCPVSTFSSRPSSPLPACNHVSEGGSAWSWMLTLSVPPAVYLTFSCFLFQQRQNGVSFNVWYEEAWRPAGPLKHFTCGSGKPVLMTWCKLVCRKQENLYGIPLWK